jgi:predicted N-acetyltransferase YhbS
MYTKSCVINEKNESMNTITFGPVSIDPKFQRKGYGSQLIKNSIDKAIENGFSAIIIYGNPMNYCHLGFCSSKRFSISNAEGKYPCGLLVKPLKEKIFENHEWKFYESKSFNVDLKGFEEFDSTFDKIEKEVRYSQEEFWIISNGYLD